MDEIKFRKMYKKLIYRFVLASILLLAVFFVKQIIIQYQIAQDKDSSYVINIAGRQRMLSQKITKDLLLIQKNCDLNIKEKHIKDLEDSLELWEEAHLGLMDLNESEGFLNRDKRFIFQMFQELEPSYKSISDSSYLIIEEMKKSDMNDIQIDAEINNVIANESVFLKQMDDIVYRYDYNAKQWLNTIQITHTALFLIILCIAVFIVFVIFIPLIKYLKNSFQKENESNKNLIKKFHAMKNIAIKDELTGMYNRHFLDNIIDEEISRSDRYETPLSGALLDLDHFKKVNDQWGHPVGDSVLKFTAEIIMKTIRISDYAFRIGGEEFLVLMPNTDSKGAVTTADKIRRAIEGAVHPVIGQFTVSLGVAERNSGEVYHSLYTRIDEALYRAKRNGRNCVVEAEKHEVEHKLISLKWNKNWDCGEENIDFQHKELFQIVSQLANSVYTGKENEEVIENINSIIKHVEEHFDYEERALNNVGFEDLDNHKIIHNHLLIRTEEIKNEVVCGKIDRIRAFAFLFDEIIVGHLLSDDTRFFHYFQKSDT